MFIVGRSSGQDRIEIDSADIEFKAKLFTISEYGIAKKDDVIAYVENQKTLFLKSGYKKFCFIKINFGQPYTLSNGHERNLIKYCSYYIVYNTEDCIFYKIGGFDTNDIEAFFYALELREPDIFSSLVWNKVEGFNMDCLYETFSKNIKRKKKIKYTCFQKCSEITSTHYRNE